MKNRSPSYLIDTKSVFSVVAVDYIAIFPFSNMKMFNVSALTCVLVLVVSRQTCTDTTLAGAAKIFCKPANFFQ